MNPGIKYDNTVCPKTVGLQISEARSQAKRKKLKIVVMSSGNVAWGQGFCLAAGLPPGAIYRASADSVQEGFRPCSGLTGAPARTPINQIRALKPAQSSL